MDSTTVRPHDARLVAPEPSIDVVQPEDASPSSVADDQETESVWPFEADRSREPLSRGVTALIGIAALALSAVCTTLLLTLASTSIDTPLVGEGSDGTTLVHTFGD